MEPSRPGPTWSDWPGVDPDRPLDEASRALLGRLRRNRGGRGVLASPLAWSALILIVVGTCGFLRFGIPLALRAAGVSLRVALETGTQILIWAAMPLAVGIFLWRLASRRELAQAQAGDLVDLLFVHLSLRRRSRMRQVAGQLFARTVRDDRPAPALGRALAAAVLAELSRDDGVARQWTRVGCAAVSVVSRRAAGIPLAQFLEVVCRRHEAREDPAPGQGGRVAADVLAEVLGGVVAAVVGGVVATLLWYLEASPFGSHHEGLLAITLIGPCLGGTLGAPVGVYLAGRWRGWRGSPWLFGVGILVIGISVLLIVLFPDAWLLFVFLSPVLALVSAVVGFLGTRREGVPPPPAGTVLKRLARST